MTVACGGSGRVPSPSYDAATRRLVRLDSDSNGDGVIDRRTYVNGNVPYRTEFDQNGDGRVDRWEYVDGRAQLLRVGTSSRDDGREDTWVHVAAQDGVRQVDRSSERSGVIDRREYYRGSDLVRVEEDTNADGVADKWEEYDGGVLRSIAYDSGRTARPDRRLVYDAKGVFVRLEIDPDRDGRFQPVDVNDNAENAVRKPPQ